MLNSISWLHFPDGHHTYGIELQTQDSRLLESFERFVSQTCVNTSCAGHTQGKNSRWIFFEFFGEGDENKILNVVELASKQFGDKLFCGEILIDEPGIEILKELGF